MKKKDILIILAIFTLAAVTDVFEAEAREINLNERRVQYYENLNYDVWKDGHEKQIKKLQIKINNMTEERFNKMKEMQLNYWKNNFS